MKLRTPHFVAFVLLTGAFTAAGTAPAQSPAAPPAAIPAAQPVPVLSGDTHSITLDVAIFDRSGAPIKGLKAEDFTVLDNRQKKTVSAMETGAAAAAASPVEAYLLIDTINSHFSVVASERHDLEQYLKRNPQLPLPTSLVFLTPEGLKMQGQPTRDPHILLANLEANPTPLRTFHDTGYYSAEALREKCLMAMNVLAVKLSKRPGRKLVVWVSPGWGEFIFQSSRMSKKEQEELFSYESSLSVALRLAHITLYSVDPMGAECVVCSQNTYYKNYLKSPASFSDADQNDLLLQTLVAKTGGKVVTGKNDIAAMVAECLADGQDYYELSFEAPPPTPGQPFHEIRVNVDRSGARTRTMTGYYTPPTPQP